LILTSTCIPDVWGWRGWTAIEALASAGTFAVAVVALFYAKSQLDTVQRENRLTHLIELVNEFEHDPLADTRKRLANERLDSARRLKLLDPLNTPLSLHPILNFFEHMGYLLRDNYIDLDGVSIEFHYWIFRIWADAERVIKYEQVDAAIYYECFESMVRRLKEYERSKGRVLDVIDEQELEDFYIEEAELPKGSPIPRVSRKKTKRNC
jgi:hypothetical protein